ncbi:MAG: DNA polymerase I, partial [Spirochaetaceae bacterium]|nr:DNA polymerase I [Spirochaetaceae bacterium]
MPESRKKIESLPPLYLIDAYGLIYRSYFAFISRPLRNAGGKNVSALFGFARTVISLLDEGAPGMDGAEKPQEALQRPLRLGVVFDSPVPTFRHKQYPAYKATRQKAPEDLHAQVPLVEETLTALGVPMLRVDGYEADDIIATLARRCQAENRQCYILSSDKDLLQLVGKGTYELRSAKAVKTAASPAAAGGGYELVGPAEVKAEWGVFPDKVLDLLSLIGDTADNVPGVKGVGEKTAVKLMARYGSLDEIYQNIAGIEGAVGKKLAEGRESAYFARSLIALNEEAPLPIAGIDDLSVENLNRSAGARVLLREGLRKSALDLAPGAASTAPETALFGAQAPAAAGERAGPPDRDGGVDPALLGEGTYRAVLEFSDLEQILGAAKKQGVMALDFETDSLDAWNARPIGISLALRPREAFYVPLAPHGGEKDGPFLESAKVRSLLAPLLAD